MKSKIKVCVFSLVSFIMSYSGHAKMPSGSAFYYGEIRPQHLPNPPGKLSDARIELCNGSVSDQIQDKYIDAAFDIAGVNGFGGHSISMAHENLFGIRCAVISVYVESNQINRVRSIIGESLDGMLVEYIESGAGVAQ